jgi:hypothetical protein
MPTPNGPRNQPRYDINDEPAFADHLTEVSDYAASTGNRKVGTASDRGALTGLDVWDGLYFWETDTKTGYLRVAGAWKVWTLDTGWLALPSLSGNYNAGTNSNYRYTVSDGRRVLETRGQLTRKTGNIGADGLFTFPAGRTPAVKGYFSPAYGPGIQGILSYDTDGRVQMEGGTVVAVNYVRLDGLRITLD